MATKLPHERLRDLADKAESAGLSIENVLAREIFHGRKGNMSCGEQAEAARDLADEIERFYIPCLLDDKGEPVQFGKEYEFGGNPFTARKMVIYGNGDVTVCDTFGGGHSYAPGERVKRHIEMLDADGDPIKVGDVVWGVKSGCKYEVIEVPDAHLFSTVDIRNVETGSTGGIYAGLLTHKEPDSLEKLRDDIRNSNHATNACAAMWDKRLTALIERGA